MVLLASTEMSITEGDIRRFWKHVKIGTDDECWPCNCTPKSPYPQFYYGGKDLNILLGAHVFAYRITYGFEGNLWVLHKCDNKRCTNPKHLYLGTVSDNLKDAHIRGQINQTGYHNPNSRLTRENVSSIHEMYRKGYKITGIAKILSVDRHTISKVLDGATYLDKNGDN